MSGSNDVHVVPSTEYDAVYVLPALTIRRCHAPVVRLVAFGCGFCTTPAISLRNSIRRLTG